MTDETFESALIDHLVSINTERVEQLVAAICTAEPVPALDPADLEPHQIPYDAPHSVMVREMERENARIIRVRNHREAEARGPMTTLGSAADARFELSEIDPTLPDELDRTLFTTGDVEQTVQACVERYGLNQAEIALWIAKGRPPMTPGWKER